LIKFRVFTTHRCLWYYI